MFHALKRLLLFLVLTVTAGLLAQSATYTPIVESVFHGHQGKISQWREDDWCKGNGRFLDGSPMPLICVGRSSVLIHRKRFSVVPGELLKGTFWGEGKANLSFCLYLYDHRGLIGCVSPRGLNQTVTFAQPWEFTIPVPQTLNQRIPSAAHLVLDFRQGANLKLQKIILNHQVKSDRIMTAGSMTVELSPKKDSITAIRLKNGTNAIDSMGFSWYAKGVWRNQTIKPDPTVIDSQTPTAFSHTTGCEDFIIKQRWTLHNTPEAVRLDLTMIPKEDFIIGGGDPPGGINFPVISPNPNYTHWLKVNRNGSTTILTKQDFPAYEEGLMPGEFIAGRCTPDGQQGYFLLLDNRFYQDADLPPFLTGNGVSQARLAFRHLKKGEAIKTQVYIIPFDGNPEAVAAQAIRAFCSSNPQERLLCDRRYQAYESTPPTTFYQLQQNHRFDLFGGNEELVLPRQVMPTRKGKTINMMAAQRENAYAQLVIRPKTDLRDVSFSVQPLKNITVKINYLEDAPSRFATTTYGMRGSIPDILAPMRTRTLTPGRNHSYLLTFAVSDKTTPGVHKGVISMKTDDMEPLDIPFELTVHDFALPVMPAYRSCFLLWTSSAYASVYDTNLYRKDHRELRITAPCEINVACDENGMISDQELKRVKAQVLNALAAGDTCYRFSGAFMWRCMNLKDKTSPQAERFIKNFFSRLAQAMREINAINYAWILMVDETHWGDPLNSNHRLWCQWAKEAAPDLPLFSTQNHPLMPVAKLVDILCGSNSSMEAIRKQLGDTKEYWLYENGFYFALGQSGLVPRSITWRSIPGKYSGYHQWCSTFWGKGFKAGDFHGTGAFYYPPEFGDGKPVRSFRIIHFSQGVADFDYIRLLQQEIKASMTSTQQTSRQLATQAQAQLNKLISTMVPDQYNFIATTEEVLQARKRMAHWILTLKKQRQNH